MDRVMDNSTANSIFAHAAHVVSHMRMSGAHVRTRTYILASAGRLKDIRLRKYDTKTHKGNSTEKPSENTKAL